MKTLPALLLMIFLAACGRNTRGSCTSMACQLSAFRLSTTDSGPVPPEALDFDAVVRTIDFSFSEQEKIDHAADLVRRVIQTQGFKDAIIGFKYDGKRNFVDNNGLTNLQIYDRIIIAAERLTPAKNHTLDAEVQLYFEDTSTIGYTYASTPRIWINTKFFNRYTPYQIAGNLTHEWLHKLGFTHAVSSTPSRPYSVPYAVGYIVRQLAAELYPDLY